MEFVSPDAEFQAKVLEQLTRIANGIDRMSIACSLLVGRDHFTDDVQQEIVYMLFNSTGPQEVYARQDAAYRAWQQKQAEQAQAADHV